ncbi:MAG: RNA polymerase factor sigma-54 [Candidatus Kapabacteria bacterium]|nr:RNA polymerase factor sigma-54 [Candidatus Kapabacteria bacterium]
MKLGLGLKTTLTQTLTPQQIQYLKLLQLPVLQLEHQVMQELEQNPMLDEVSFEDSLQDNEIEFNETPETDSPEIFTESDTAYETEDFSEVPQSKLIDDSGDPFEFYKLIWQDDSEHSSSLSKQYDSEDDEPFQIKDNTTLIEDLTQQVRMLDLTDEEFLIATHILGNIDNDGYLRRDLVEIVEEVNTSIAETNLLKINEFKKINLNQDNHKENPARQFALNNHYSIDSNSTKNETYKELGLLNEVNIEQAEKVLKIIQNLDPPGIASRTVQECLIAQCKALPKNNAAKKLALEILENAYDAFSKKHFHVIKKQFEVGDEYLREALDLIRRLNPKPGGTDSSTGTNTVIPDFIIDQDEETGELLITVNDSRIPVLRLSQAYDKLKKEARFKHFNKETKEWLKTKYEDAKFLIQAIRQRKNTMLKVMTAIAGRQREFFNKGQVALKPLIYKDISDETGLDISTVCRIVNGKYVQTRFGTFELKYFFSESLPNEDGEEVSTSVIKQIIKEIIDSEPKNKPYSDDKIAEELKKRGYLVARRTVAKYREQLKIPVARLRKDIV